MITTMLGTFTRYYLSRFNQRWPFGTFATNMMGTMLSSMLTILLYHFSSGSMTIKNVLHALIDGYCGSMTTVSTWIMEMVVMYTITKTQSILYGISSILVGLLSVFLGFGVWFFYVI